MGFILLDRITARTNFPVMFAGRCSSLYTNIDTRMKFQSTGRRTAIYTSPWRRPFHVDDQRMMIGRKDQVQRAPYDRDANRRAAGNPLSSFLPLSLSLSLPTTTCVVRMTSLLTLPFRPSIHHSVGLSVCFQLLPPGVACTYMHRFRSSPKAGIQTQFDAQRQLACPWTDCRSHMTSPLSSVREFIALARAHTPVD